MKNICIRRNLPLSETLYTSSNKQRENRNYLSKSIKKRSYFLIEEHFVEALTLSSNEEEFSRLAESLETCGLIDSRLKIVQYTELAKIRTNFENGELVSGETFFKSVVKRR